MKCAPDSDQTRKANGVIYKEDYLLSALEYQRPVFHLSK